VSKRIEPDDGPPRRRRMPEPPEENPRRDRVAYIVGALLIVFGLFTGAVAYTMVRSHTLNPLVGVVSYFVPSPESVFGKERVYVALYGLDYDYDNLDNPTSKDSRTDKIEIFALDFPSKVIKSVAVPRDMDAVVGGHEDKINSAYQNGGWKYTDQVVGSFLGMPKNENGLHFDRYVTLRINASKDIINAIGGLDVPVTETINYDDNWGHLHIHFTPGLIHMDGDQAVSYARFRHDACSDPCRIKRQQQIEKLTIEKLKNDKFNDLTHIAQLIDVVRRNVDTNMSPDEMKALGWHFRDVNMADIHATQVPFIDDKVLACCGDVLVPDTAGTAKIIADFTGPYEAVEPPPDPGAIAAVKPSDLRVDVRNGSGIPGLGAKLAATLRKEGYKVTSVGNADSFDYDITQIRATPRTPLAGERVRSDMHLAAATVTPIPLPTSSEPALADVTVIIGRDFAASLNPANAAATKE
jgi:LCP family protein required for cell wall assembly